MRRRTSVSGDLASRNCRTVRRSSSCSSEKAKFILLLLLLAGLASTRLSGEPQNPFTDDVSLDLTCAGVDGLRPARHKDVVQLVEVVRVGVRVRDGERVGAEHLHRGLAESLVPRRPVELADTRLGTER